MNRIVGLGVGLIVFALICLFCIRRDAPMIEHDVMSRTALALLAGGVSPQGLSVSGRDVLLSGPKGSAIVSDATRQLASAVEGVRVVNISTDGTASVALLEPDAKTVSAIRPPTLAKPQQAINTLLQSKTVEFDTNSAVLNGVGRETLDKIVPILKASPTLKCQISGYTDTYGNKGYNLSLSTRRAKATRDYLIAQGINAERLSATGFGDANPLASNGTQDGRRQNRRIEFLLKENN